MYHNKKLATLLLRNEDWLISRVLSSIKDFRKPGYASLINHSWRQTIKDFSDILIQYYEKPLMTDNFQISSFFDISVFKKFTDAEAERCHKTAIGPEIYLAYLKAVREAYVNLIEDYRLSNSEKKEFLQYMHHSFNAVEISFVQSFNNWEQENRKLISEIENSSGILFESAFENTSIPLLIIDPFHRVVTHNKTAAKVFPFLLSGSHKPIVKSTIFDEKDIINSKIDEFRISNQKEASFAAHIKLKNKNHFFSISLRKLSETDFILAGFIDLTEWKELEKNLEISRKKAEESDTLKTAFLANMSHEIRTPMNAIVGFAELLTMSNPKPEEREEYLNLIRKSSNDLLNIIEDIIDIAKIESKQLKICPKNTNLFELVTDLEKLYSEVLMKHGKDKVKIHINVSESEQKLVSRTDPKRLKQVLSNLIGNALKFTDSGKIEIGYKLAENKIIYFFVKDTGIGIPYNMQKKVFEQFVQVEEAYDKNINGTGLGLAICKNIINLLGGNIWVTSQPEKGSNFYFYLPYIKAGEKKAIAIQPDHDSDTIINLSKYCILIAEDEETNFLYLQESLKHTGIKIVHAKNGLEAIHHTENNDNIDLILMDIKMPEVSGIEATRYIKHIRPSLPVIAQTAFAMDNDRKACLEAGCTDYLSKPLTLEKLISIVEKYIIRTNQQTINSSSA